MCAVLSLICVYSRYPFLRPLTVVDAVGIAEALVDIFLIGMGVARDGEGRPLSS